MKRSTFRLFSHCERLINYLCLFSVFFARFLKSFKKKKTKSKHLFEFALSWIWYLNEERNYLETFESIFFLFFFIFALSVFT